MELRSPRPFPPSPAALSPSRRYKINPRAPLFRFRRSPLALAVGFVLAPCSSLSAVAAELRFATVVAPVLLPTRRHLHRLRRVVADPVRRSASPADRRSTVVIVIPNRAAVFFRFGRRSRRRRRPGWGPAVSRPRPRVRLTRGTHGADRRQPRAPGPPWTERLTRGPHSRGPGPRALSLG
ncbi:HGWP repeat containing protein-like [Oryza sativa Japonica Group]|uniref:HGWP repeat containing protein-like n=1 Tax=Oryza sativa subsp. japonica TaxID=39947 RepID=Q5JJW7_ORYSJ|nr:HGWP repeat containing protein-like [Oryza sativa Japonica Group]BAD88240.1 HGWP repeat containing protein-like [Oryza sativa Japonica Group]